MSIYLGTTKVSGAYTIAKNIGEVFYSQSSSAADNPGGLPLFTGEMISNADQLYPQFYNWVLNHAELCTTNSEYETSINNWGRCPYYVINDTNKTIKLPKLSSNKRYLIDSGKSNNLWYRIYNDGFCEQGGEFTGTFVTDYQFNLLKEFIDTNYIIITSSIRNTNSGACYNAKVKTTTYFTGEAFRGTDGGVTLQSLSWTAYGYVDVSDYLDKELYPWVFAYNTAISASVAQAAQFQAALSGKVDTDLNNIDPSFVTNLISSAITGMMPDYTAGESKTWNTEYVADKNGWVAIYSFCSDDTNNPAILLVNNVDVLHFAGYYDAMLRIRMIAPVAVGDTYKAYGGDGEQSIQFFPCKAESQISE